MAYTYPGTLAVTRIIINHLDFLHNAYREKEGSKRLKKAYAIKVCFSMKNTFTATQGSMFKFGRLFHILELFLSSKINL